MKQNIENQSGNLGVRHLLCDEQTTRVSVTVWAEWSEGCLTISGQDLGQAVTDVFVDIDYEYYYEFDRQNTERLFTLLNPEGQNIN